MISVIRVRRVRIGRPVWMGLAALGLVLALLASWAMMRPEGSAPSAPAAAERSATPGVVPQGAAVPPGRQGGTAAGIPRATGRVLPTKGGAAPGGAPAAGGPANTLRGCPNLPAGDIWHADVSHLPVAAGSAAYIASIGAGKGVHPDFGAGDYGGGPIGIPITYVGAGQARVPVSFDYADESDPGPYPIPRAALIEGGPNADGDRHILIVDTAACRLYELFDAHPNANGSWHAGSGAVYDLRSHRLRPAGWTSADAAGLPIVPGLVRYEEVAAGRIDHAIRVTVPRSQARYLWPARHAASSSNDAALPPMGLRLRLKSTVDIAGLPAQARIVAQAMKTYGVIVADNGSGWYISGAPDAHWSNDALAALGNITGTNFEAVDASSLMSNPNTGQTR
jgi:hypothetical protein